MRLTALHPKLVGKLANLFFVYDDTWDTGSGALRGNGCGAGGNRLFRSLDAFRNHGSAGLGGKGLRGTVGGLAVTLGGSTFTGLALRLGRFG